MSGPGLLALALLIGAGAPGSAVAQFQGVKLAAAGDATIRFELAVPAPRFEAVPSADGTGAATRLVLDGHESGVGAGDRALPGRIVVVAVPPLGDVRVSAVGGEPEVHEAFRLAPVPGAPSGPAAAGGGVRAELLGVGWLRNQRIARIAVHPADYDAGSRRLVVYRRVEVTVAVDPAGDLGPPAESPDPFEEVYRGALLNYEQGRGWRRPATRRLLAGAALRPERLAAFAAAVPETSIYVGRQWIKIAVQQSGFYKVEYRLVRNLSLFSGDVDVDASAPLDSLRLFNWPGVPVLPVDSYCDSCDYREVAIAFQDDGDGRFGTNTDAFYFFAMGPSDWASLYDASRPESIFVDHPYETNNYYYLARSTPEAPMGGTPMRIASVNGTITDPSLSASTPVTFPARGHFEQDLEYWPNASPLYSINDRARFWEKWFWQGVSPGGSSTAVPPVDLPGADVAQPFRLRALAWGLNAPDDYPLHAVSADFNGLSLEPAPRVFYGMLEQVYDVTLANLQTAGNQFMMRVPTTVSQKTGLAWYDLYYRRAFQPVGECLAFDTPAGGNGGVIYRLGPFAHAAPPFVFDVTDPVRPVQVFIPVDTTQYAPRPDGYYLSFQVVETSRRRYRVVGTDSITSVPQPNILEAPLTSFENLRSFTERADYIIIYYDGFRAAADSLAAWRREHLPLAGATAPFMAKTVPISALYDQFSGGRTDPAAIRNFLRAAFYNWNGGGDPRRPSFVTLLGDASYDFKNITGRAPAGQPGCLVPTYEDNFDYGVMRQFVTDDWMLNVDSAAVVIPDFNGGRLPVGDPATALAVVVGKVLAHERSSPLGEWRNRLMLIADDDMQGAKPDPLLWTHLKQTMRLDAWFTPPHIDREYVYLHTYPTGPGASKPGAKAAIRQGINDGVSLVNFVGHGSPFQLADERVMLDSDVGALTNAPRFTVLVAASCDVGKFSDPTVQSLGERLITSTAGGAVGVISATELSFSGQNATLNQDVYRQLFSRDTICQYHTPLSAALLATKTGAVNPQKYQLMGDGATQMALPRLWVDIAVVDSTGAPLTAVKRGRTLAFRGRVLTCPGGGAVPLDGVVRLLIEDSQPIDSVMTDVVYEGERYVDSTHYYYRAGAIYRGDVGVANGEFHGRFVVPMEAREGDRGRLRAYVQGRAAGEGFDTDGVGFSATAVDSGAAPPGDVTGPRIGLSFVGGATSVRADAVLQVDLYDENGILTTDHSPRNGIIVTVDDNSASRVDITESFRYAADSYQSGRATFQLPDLAAGPHKVGVSAADNQAAGLGAGLHRSEASLDFIVVDQPNLRITRARLFPNPTQSRADGGGGGQFVVDAPGDSVNTLLRIYTASGRLIRTLTVFGGLEQVQVPWDGLDEEGDPLANGVYFFRVHINPRDPDGRSSPSQKAHADGRFVIVNR